MKQNLLLALWAVSSWAGWSGCTPSSAEHTPARPTVAASVATTSRTLTDIGAHYAADAASSGQSSSPKADRPSPIPPSSEEEKPARTSAATFEYALLISVDGLRSDALRAVAASELPNFKRLLSGSATLNARTDPDYTVTLPNHTDMITGRPVLGPSGHGWVKNDEAEKGETIHKNHGAYVASMFDVAHDRGFHTALFAGKSKFSLYDSSYDSENGAPDASSNAPSTASADAAPKPVAADAASAGHGRKKIDAWKFAPKTEEIADLVIANLGAAGQPSLVFAHYAITDLTGHANGWDVTPRSRYMQAVATVDKELGRILDAVESSERLHGKTVIVLTADHGGGAPFKSHDQTQMWIDYIIPFLVWTGDGAKGGDLYALNAGVRRDPGLTSPRLSDAGLPPIRNGDAANLLLSLLGLPGVPGSTFDARQDLKIN